MVGGTSASDGTDVSGSVSVSARLFPSRLFGYTLLGDAKKVFEIAVVSLGLILTTNNIASIG